MLKHFTWSEIEIETVSPQVERQHVVVENAALARMSMKKGWVVPLHSHVSEQITCVEKGVLEFTIDNRKIVVAAGEILCIPPNMPHEAQALEDTVIFDIFSPPRADWINKTDTYLRKN